MRRYTKKTAKRYRDDSPAREALRSRIPCCEWCGKREFVLHEIPRGNMRSYVSGLPSCILGLCDPGCHQEVAGWPKAKQLSLLWMRRPADLDLATYNSYSIANVHADEILQFATELRLEGAA